MTPGNNKPIVGNVAIKHAEPQKQSSQTPSIQQTSQASSIPVPQKPASQQPKPVSGFYQAYKAPAVVTPTSFPPTVVLTKTGKPDRRIRGQENMELPAPIRIAGQGEVDEHGRHYTLTGKADRRFIENHGMSEEEAQLLGAEFLLRKAGKLK